MIVPRCAAQTMEVTMTKFRLVRLGDAKVLTRGGLDIYFELGVQPADQPMA